MDLIPMVVFGRTKRKSTNGTLGFAIATAAVSDVIILQITLFRSVSHCSSLFNLHITLNRTVYQI